MSFLIRFPDQIHGPGAIGAKAEAFFRLAQAGIGVPRWFVVTTEAFEAALSFEQSDALRYASSASEAAAALADLVCPEPICAALTDAMGSRGLDRDDIAMRASLDPEDWQNPPTFPVAPAMLSVRASALPERLAQIWRTAFSERVLIHRRTHGMHMLPLAPAVIVQQMLRPQVAGLAYGMDLVSGRRSVSVIASVYGLATSLTAGESEADLYHVGLDGKIVLRSIAEKRVQHRANGDCRAGYLPVNVPMADRNAPSLTDAQAAEVASLVRRVEAVFERPQEIEWAYDGGQLYLLGVRALSGLERLPDPDAPRTYWDLGNTAEFFPDFCSPLTFSFVREATGSLARSFCRRMGVSHRRIEELAASFDNLAGSFRGRIYGNVGNWYRIFSLLPDYPANARYYARVSGLTRPLPTSEEAALAPGWRGKWSLPGRFMALIVNWLSLGSDMDRFERRVKAALSAVGMSLDRARADELASAYETLRRLFLADCDALALNDFYTMVSFALLRYFSERWCSDTSGALVNDLLLMRETLAVDELRAMVRAAREVAGIPELLDAMRSESASDVRRELDRVPLIRREVERLLDVFGDRAIGELRFEAVDFHTDPVPFYRAIARAAVMAPDAIAALTGDHGVRDRAEEFVVDSVGGRPMRSAVFHWLLHQVIERVSDRVHLAALRRSLFGRIRAIVIELGRRYFALGLIREPGDIVYLSMDEAIGAVRGGVATGSLSALVDVRKTEFAGFGYQETPPARFEANMPVATARLEPLPAVGDETRRVGTGVCRGTVRGRVYFAECSDGAEFAPGDILAIESADPTWLLLYPSAGGLLIAFGGHLSQAVVTARTIGLPTVVGFDDLTSWLVSGDTVELNGETGVVTRVG